MSRDGGSRQWREIVEEVSARVKDSMRGVRSSHGIDHVMRVHALATRIAREEGAMVDVVEAAALLHDIGRQAEDESGGELCHARLGGEMASRHLEQMGADARFVEDVVHCVRTHRFRGSEVPTSPEAQALFDADKLDSIGAVGLGRAFLFAGEEGARLHNPEVDCVSHPGRGPEDSALREFLVKLRHVRDRMFTATGRRIAEGRHEFMVSFFDQIDAEVTGER